MTLRGTAERDPAADIRLGWIVRQIAYDLIEKGKDDPAAAAKACWLADQIFDRADRHGPEIEQAFIIGAMAYSLVNDGRQREIDFEQKECDDEIPF